jgi:sugar phosphate isomerase/epimerase
MTTVNDLSIQLYSMREYADLDRQLAALAESGFKLVETVGGHLADARDTRAKLDAHGLKAPTGHVGMADLRSRLDWVAEQAKIVGIEHLFMPAVPVDEREAPAEHWRNIGRELAGMAERLAGHGLALGYHNHHWELRPCQDGGGIPLELLMDGAQGSKLTYEADLAWLARGGADPEAWLERFGDRLAAVHVKDIAKPGQGQDEDGWCDVGQGTLDWKHLWQASQARGAKWMILEHDKPKDPVAFARNSRAYIAQIAA